METNRILTKNWARNTKDRIPAWFGIVEKGVRQDRNFLIQGSVSSYLQAFNKHEKTPKKKIQPTLVYPICWSHFRPLSRRQAEIFRRQKGHPQIFFNFTIQVFIKLFVTEVMNWSILQFENFESRHVQSLMVPKIHRILQRMCCNGRP